MCVGHGETKDEMAIRTAKARVVDNDGCQVRKGAEGFNAARGVATVDTVSHLFPPPSPCPFYMYANGPE